MRIRVEELARRADVSVDTIRFYQKRRLLPAPEREGRIAWYGEAHVERLGRIRELQRQGLPLEVIRRLVEGDLDTTDASLAVAVAGARDDEADPTEELLTLDELAARSGVPAALIEAVAREGLLVARVHDGRPWFTTADVELVAAGLALLETGLPLPDLLGLARRHHAETRAIAEDAVAMFDAHVRRPIRSAGLPPDDAAARIVDAFRVLLPSVTTLVAHHFRRVLLEVAQEHLAAVGEPEEVAAATAEEQRRIEAGLPG